MAHTHLNPQLLRHGQTEGAIEAPAQVEAGTNGREKNIVENA